MHESESDHAVAFARSSSQPAAGGGGGGGVRAAGSVAVGGTQRRVGWVEGQGQGDDGAGVVSGQRHRASADRVTAHAVAGGVKVRSGGVGGPSEAGAGVGGGGLAEDEYGLPAPMMESDDEEEDVVQVDTLQHQLAHA